MRELNLNKPIFEAFKECSQTIISSIKGDVIYTMIDYYYHLFICKVQMLT